MKNNARKYILLNVLFAINLGLSAQTDTAAKEVVGISGQSIYSKYLVQIIGNKKDTISVFDSGIVKLPLISDYYSLRVHRINFKGEKIEYQIKGYNMVLNLNNDSSFVQEIDGRYMEEPLLGHFKRAKSGNMVSFGEIEVMEGDRTRNVGSF